MKSGISITKYLRYILSSWLFIVDFEEAFVRLFHCKVSFPPCALWKEVTGSSLPLESGELCLTILRPENLYKWSGILHEKCVCFPPCIYLFNHSLILVCTHGYLFHTLEWNSTLFYCLIYFSSSHEELLSWRLCPFDILHQFGYFCFIF